MWWSFMSEEIWHHLENMIFSLLKFSKSWNLENLTWEYFLLIESWSLLWEIPTWFSFVESRFHAMRNMSKFWWN
jgi:hypothetical protein